MESQIEESTASEQKENPESGHEALLGESLLTNAKLAKAMELLVEFNLTTKEKIDITKRIDCSNSLDELAGTIKLIRKELSKSYVDESTGEKWSPDFIKEIVSHYETGLGFNPLEKVGEEIKIMESYVELLESEEEVTEDAKKVYQESLKNIKETFEKMHS